MPFSIRFGLQICVHFERRQFEFARWRGIEEIRKRVRITLRSKERISFRSSVRHFLTLSSGVRGFPNRKSRSESSAMGNVSFQMRFRRSKFTWRALLFFSQNNWPTRRVWQILYRCTNWTKWSSANQSHKSWVGLGSKGKTGQERFRSRRVAFFFNSYILPFFRTLSQDLIGKPPVFFKWLLHSHSFGWPCHWLYTCKSTSNRITWIFGFKVYQSRSIFGNVDDRELWKSKKWSGYRKWNEWAEYCKKVR